MAQIVNLFLIAFFAFLLAGIFILRAGFKKAKYRWLSVLYLLMAIAFLAYYFYSTAANLQIADILIRTGISAIIIFPVTFLYFIGTITKTTFSKKSLSILGIAAILLVIVVATNLFDHIQIVQNGSSFSYRIIPLFTWIYWGSAAFYFLLAGRLVWFWRKSRLLNREKIKANIILLSLILSVLILVSDYFFFDYNIIEFPYTTFILPGALLLAVMTFGLIYFEKGDIAFASEQVLLLSLSSDLVFFLNREGKIGRHNHSAIKNLGYSSDKLMFMPFVDLIWSAEKELFVSLIASNNPFEHDFNCVTSENEKIPVAIRFNVVFDNYGDPAGFIIVGHDQRNEKKLKQEAGLNRELQYELLKAKEKASESDKLKSAFLSIVTHELRTPLNGILGFTELLKSDLEGTPHFEMVDYLDKSGKRLLGTINSIIDLSLIETNKSEINKQPVDLKNIIIEKSKPYIAYAQSKSLNFEINILHKGLWARTDERMFGHVLSNLLDNAVKYTDDGGITVSLEAIETTRRVKALIKVADTGIGIDKKNFSKIFEKFRQGSEGYNRAYEGMGIGLSICKTFVELLDSEIWVESEPGKGSVFYLQLSAYFINKNTESTENGTDKPASDDEKKQHKRPCAMIVEENQSNRKFIKYLLLEAFEVDEAVNGIEALELSQKNFYDLIFISINPETEAIETEAMKKIKALPGYEAVPVAAVTTNLQKNESEDLLERGFTHYITKPYTRASILETANEMLKSSY